MDLRHSRWLPASEQQPQAPDARRAQVQYAGIVSAALVVWLLLAVVTILGSPTYLWEAVA